jgi:hypothetical protein
MDRGLVEGEPLNEAGVPSVNHDLQAEDHEGVRDRVNPCAR